MPSYATVTSSVSPNHVLRARHFQLAGIAAEDNLFRAHIWLLDGCKSLHLAPNIAVELLTFLLLKDKLEPGCDAYKARLSPPEEFDALWHWALLFTKEYQQLCHSVIGSFVHHSVKHQASDAASRLARRLCALNCLVYTCKARDVSEVLEAAPLWDLVYPELLTCSVAPYWAQDMQLELMAPKGWELSSLWSVLPPGLFPEHCIFITLCGGHLPSNALLGRCRLLKVLHPHPEESLKNPLTTCTDCVTLMIWPDQVQGVEVQVRSGAMLFEAIFQIPPGVLPAGIRHQDLVSPGQSLYSQVIPGSTIHLILMTSHVFQIDIVLQSAGSTTARRVSVPANGRWKDVLRRVKQLTRQSLDDVVYRVVVDPSLRKQG
eukprot:jgi/Chrzof1/12255/Cz06g27110.t1